MIKVTIASLSVLLLAGCGKPTATARPAPTQQAAQPTPYVWDATAHPISPDPDIQKSLKDGPKIKYLKDFKASGDIKP